MDSKKASDALKEVLTLVEETERNRDSYKDTYSKYAEQCGILESMTGIVSLLLRRGDTNSILDTPISELKLKSSHLNTRLHHAFRAGRIETIGQLLWILADNPGESGLNKFNAFPHAGLFMQNFAIGEKTKNELVEALQQLDKRLSPRLKVSDFGRLISR